MDNFRINCQQARKVTLQEDESSYEVSVEYLAHNKFTVTAVETGDVILENAELLVNPEKAEEIIVRTEKEQFKIPYLIGKDGSINCLDEEGAPLNTVSVPPVT